MTDVPSETTAIAVALRRLIHDVLAEDGAAIGKRSAAMLGRAETTLAWLETRQAKGSEIAARFVLEDDEVRRDQAIRYACRDEVARLVAPRPLAEAGARQAPSSRMLERRIQEKSGIDVRIGAIDRLWTETSKEIFLLDVEGPANWPRRAVLRREPPIAVVPTSVADEFDVLAAAYHAGLPVPQPLFAEADATVFAGRALLAGLVPGTVTTLPALGDDAPALLEDAAAFLARLHAIDPDEVPRYRTSESLPVVMRRRIEQSLAEWHSGALDRSPTVEAAFAWLLARVDHLDPTTAIVHGDFDLRNILAQNGRLSAVLDWELSVRGHPAQDLGYFWPQVTNAMSWERFMTAYRAAGGADIPDETVHFFAIWSQAWRLAVAAPLSAGFFRGHHGDLLLGSLRFVEQNVYLDDLARALLVAIEPSGAAESGL